MDWNMFVTTLTATGFASAAFVFLAKILSQHLLSMDLERFKAELKATNDKELERLRTDLQITAFQQETTFAKLHERRAEVIANLYGKLSILHTAIQKLLYPYEPDEGVGRQQREEETSDAAIAFARYFDVNKIYLEESLCVLLEKFHHDIIKAWIMHRECTGESKGGLSLPREREEAWKHLTQQVPPIREEIEATFRQILGLTQSSTTQPKAG